MIDRAQIAKNLWPGIKAHFGTAYPDMGTQYTELFDVQSSDKAFEEMQMEYSFALAPLKNPGQAIEMDDAGNAWTVRVQHSAYAKGFLITREAMEDDQYFELSTKYSKELKRSMMLTREVNAAAYYDNAFSSGQLGGDGVALCSASHPLTSGGTLSNLGTAGDLTEAALEAGTIAIRRWTDERGHKVPIRAKSLHVAPTNQPTASRLLGSTMRPGTADNDRNYIRDENLLPGGYKVNDYFTDQRAWFLRTDAPTGMIYFDRTPLDVQQGDGIDNQVMKVVAYMRYSFVHGDWRAIYGVDGA